MTHRYISGLGCLLETCVQKTLPPGGGATGTKWGLCEAGPGGRSLGAALRGILEPWPFPVSPLHFPAAVR